ncbi:MAG: hypothetical protein V2A71_01360 [Candidatus Eisenbacteria bacterium]
MRSTSLARRAAMPRVLTAAVFLSALVLLAPCVIPRETSFWTTDRASDFRSGTLECVSVSSRGVVSLAPALDTLVVADESYFWCMALDGKGNLYAGSGDGGKVYRLDERGRASVVLDSPELEILSLVALEDGTVYAGTSPGGVIYRIGAGGESSVFFESGESYVWCLCADGKGNLYAGTGDRGRVYRIGADGSGRVFYETGERHVMCARMLGDNLVIGTEGSGLVVSVSQDGKGRVLYDCSEEEVKDIAVAGDGRVYVAAVTGGGEKKSRDVEARSDEPYAQSGEEKKLSSSVYRVSQDGSATKLWSTSRSTVHCLGLAGEDSLVVGTGDNGVIYGLTSDMLGIVLKVAESQVLDVVLQAGAPVERGREKREGVGTAPGRGAFLFCTGNRAGLYRAGPLVCTEGSLTSKPFDAAGISRWGSVRWEGEVPQGSSIALQVRSGNSEKPDKTWSEWSAESETAGQVPAVAPGRFVQWRALLRSSRGKASPSLSRVVLSYLEKNLPPKVSSVQVSGQDVPFSRGGMDRAPERVSQALPGGLKVEYSIVGEEEGGPGDEAGWATALRTCFWEASDANGDRLSFSIYYRGVGEGTWKVIKEDFRQSLLAWNTSSVADGSYVLKVVASDAGDNVPEDASTGENVSSAFEVDNTPPAITGVGSKRVGSRVVVSGTVADRMSPVVAVDYSVDGGAWRRAQSADGLFDSTKERFSITIEGLARGAHTVAVRGRDRSQNLVTVAVELK